MNAASGSCYLPGTMVFDLSPADGGAPYRIFVSKPVGDMPAAGWPVLYLADGNACFPFAAAAHGIQALYPKSTGLSCGLIIGIGYPDVDFYDPLRRSRDLTPPPGSTYPAFTPEGPEVRTGGADAFLDFIDNDLRPQIEAMFTVDSTRQTLFGHSFGGLFTLYAMFSRPGGFSRYFAASPSIYWENCCICGFEKQFLASHPVPATEAYLTAGEYEGESLAPFEASAPDATTRLEARKQTRTAVRIIEMAGRLDAASLSVKHEIFAGENHLSSIPASVARALQFAFA